MLGVPGGDHGACPAGLAREEGCMEGAGHEGPLWDTRKGVLLEDPQ